MQPETMDHPLSPRTMSVLQSNFKRSSNSLSQKTTKVNNPVKEGLADTTLKILKACLKTLKDRHMKEVGKNGITALNYLPTV